MNRMEAKRKEVEDRVIQAFYTVYNRLGYGFLEKVYENAIKVSSKAWMAGKASRTERTRSK
jgi:hypothetical protein